jgi:predicted nuclease of predicted toxin-antitoxin system
VYDVTIKWLRGKGHDVVTAKELGLERASDEELLRKAKELGRIMLTRDKGFGALVFLKPEKAPGVILVRGSPGTIEEVHRELSGSLKNTRRKKSCSAWWGRADIGFGAGHGGNKVV